jgi:hypothetical protein
MKSIFLIGIFLISNVAVFAQLDTSTTTIDTAQNPIQNKVKIPKKEKTPFLGFLKEEGNEPKKAAFYSAIIPGGGQVFNKQYWKAPIAFAAVGGAGYAVYFNATEYRRYRNAYRERVDDDPTTIDEFYNNPNATEAALVEIRDNHRKWMEQSYIALVVVHGLNVLEAYTSAHLKNFEINDDLSLHWEPTIKIQNSWIPSSNMEFGISMQLINRKPDLKVFF